MDKRKKMTKQITNISLLLIGIVIGALLNSYINREKWEDKQAKLPNTLGLVSPLQQLQIQPVHAKEATQEATRANLTKESSEDGQVDTEIIRMLESSKGTAGLAVTCKARGLSNEYGYLGKKDTGHCYESHEVLTMIVKHWFERKVAKMSLAEALCLYNTGIKQNNCEYYQNYLKLGGR